MDTIINNPQPDNLFTTTEDCDCADCACSIENSGCSIKDMPAIYSLELTPLCNNRCAGCSNVFLEDKANRIMALARSPMSITQWHEILQKIAPYAVRLKITGGEPTFHPYFEQIIQEVDRCDIAFTLFTHARWKSPLHTVGFLKTVKACSGLLISLHGATADAHDAFTGVKGSFKETVTNIKLATQAGISVHTSCVFTRHNAGQIRDIVELSKDLGASMTVFNRYIGTPTEISLTALELAQAIRCVDELRQSNPIRFGTCIPLCFVESTSTGCLAGTAYCTIDPWGNMRPCNHAPWVTGNILTGSLSEAWHSDVMNQWRALVSNECFGCSYFSKCRGGCRADAILNECERDPLIYASVLCE